MNIGRLANKSGPSPFLLTAMAFSRRHSTFLSSQSRKAVELLTHDPLPTIMAEEVPLVLLFQNLIGNALKYHRPGEAPRVHVSAQPSGNLWTFSVTDNGLGIEAAYLETIFAPFKRLHGSEHPGSGIGLAICHKSWSVRGQDLGGVRVRAGIYASLYDSWLKRPRREGMPDLGAISRTASFAKSSVTVGGILRIRHASGLRVDDEPGID